MYVFGTFHFPFRLKFRNYFSESFNILKIFFSKLSILNFLSKNSYLTFAIGDIYTE